MTAADELVEHSQGRAFIADTGYDSDRLARKIRRRGMKVVICPNPTRKRNRCRLDRKLYGQRFRIECLIHKLKSCRAVASRYDKSARNYLATVEVACAWTWLN